MATNIITIVNNSPIGLDVSAPTSSVTVGSHLKTEINKNGVNNAPQYIAVSIPYTGPGNANLTSMGKGTLGSSTDASGWRLRNGAAGNGSGTLKGYQTAFSQVYDLPGDHDTFVISPISNGSATHELNAVIPGITSKTIKASATTTNFITSTPTISNTDNYLMNGGPLGDTLTGSSGLDTILGNGGNDSLLGGANNDSLIGSVGNDTLSGQGGNDALTGGDGSDWFTFTKEGIDTVTDFLAGTNNDVFAFTSANYLNAPTMGTSAVANDVAGYTSATTNVLVDDFLTIAFSGITDVHFAVTTLPGGANPILYYNQSSNWSSTSAYTGVANIVLTGTLESDNFAFV